MIKIVTTIKDKELVKLYESLSDDERDEVEYRLGMELQTILEDAQTCANLNGFTGLAS